jgi:hypothetical protein
LIILILSDIQTSACVEKLSHQEAWLTLLACTQCFLNRWRLIFLSPTFHYYVLLFSHLFFFSLCSIIPSLSFFLVFCTYSPFSFSLRSFASLFPSRFAIFLS